MCYPKTRQLERNRLFIIFFLYKKYYNEVTHAEHTEPDLAMQKEQRFIKKEPDGTKEPATLPSA